MVRGGHQIYFYILVLITGWKHCEVSYMMLGQVWIVETNGSGYYYWQSNTRPRSPKVFTNIYRLELVVCISQQELCGDIFTPVEHHIIRRSLVLCGGYVGVVHI